MAQRLQRFDECNAPYLRASDPSRSRAVCANKNIHLLKDGTYRPRTVAAKARNRVLGLAAEECNITGAILQISLELRR